MMLENVQQAGFIVVESPVNKHVYLWNKALWIISANYSIEVINEN